LRPPPTSPLFPYTTLFRSLLAPGVARLAGGGTGGEQLEPQARSPAHRHLGDLPSILGRQRRRAGEGRAGPAVVALPAAARRGGRSEEHTSELQSRFDLVCR